jgi:selenocysteine-specific elongation factor
VSAGLTIGTAGHIDHGKTALVRALTGIDTDRLPEERRRGISIELGYAPLVLGCGTTLSVVDVPGHERFIATMVAGASGIDVVLIVVACDDGVMPQTREHVAICALLGIERSVVVLSKRDLVDEIEADLARTEVRELLAGTVFASAEIIECSVADPASVERVRTAIARATEGLGEPERPGSTRLAVDRAFTVRGIGSVVTGTLWSGSVGTGDQLVLAPDGAHARVRSVEVHGRTVERAEAGRRVAASLVGVDHGWARRGQMLVMPGTYPESFRLDVVLEALPDGPGLAQGARVRVLHGTSDIPARVRLLDRSEVRPGKRALAQLRLQERAVAARGDRLIVRLATPAATVAGGVVLDPAPRRHGAGERVLAHLTILEHGSCTSIVASLLASVSGPLSLDQLAPVGLLSRAQAGEALESLKRSRTIVTLGPGVWIDAAVYDALRDRVIALLETRATSEPLRPTVPIAILLPAAGGRDALIDRLAADGVLVRKGTLACAPGVRTSAADAHAQAAAAVLAALDASGTTPPRAASLASITGLEPRDFQSLVEALEREGEVIRLGTDVLYRGSRFAEARAWVEHHCRETGSVTLPELRNELMTSRRIARAILDRLDGDGVTRRIGDTRVLRRRRTPKSS